MKITREWLKEQSACKEGYEWFVSQEETDTVKVLRKLLKEDKFDWANWTIVRLMTHKQKVQYAVFTAEQVLGIFEKKYPDDKRPRQAIEAAKKWADNPTEENRQAAYKAADAANAAYAADAADAAANAAADAVAYKAANAAYKVADAAYAAANAAYAAYKAADAAYAAAYKAADAVANAAKKSTQKKIIEYGIKLLKGGREMSEEWSMRLIMFFFVTGIISFLIWMTSVTIQLSVR